MTVAAEENEFLARIRAMARTIQRVSTWVAGAALVVGIVTLAALWPWLTRPGGPGFVVSAAISLVLVAAPLRVIWHGRRIVAVYGHPGHIERALESVPGALDQAIVGLEAVADQPDRGLRGMIGTYRAVNAVQEMWEGSPAFGPVRAIVEPVHPDKLGITMAAVWVSLGTLVLGLPVVFASMVALALT
jgi:hypothetical protein